METFFSIERPRDEFTFAPEADDTAVLKEVTQSPEAYPGCLVDAMHAANSGNGDAREAVMSTVVASRGSDLAMSCGRCGLTMVRDGGIVYGASRCPKVQSGQTSLGELA
jgi:hypothetical protein